MVEVEQEQVVVVLEVEQEQVAVVLEVEQEQDVMVVVVETDTGDLGLEVPGELVLAEQVQSVVESSSCDATDCPRRDALRSHPSHFNWKRVAVDERSVVAMTATLLSRTNILYTTRSALDSVSKKLHFKRPA